MGHSRKVDASSCVRSKPKETETEKTSWRSEKVEPEEAGKTERNFCSEVLGNNPEFIPRPPAGCVPLTVLFTL